MKIKLWPYEDRPREKLLTSGAKSLTDAELIAILLGAGTRKKTALDLAHELLYSCGDLKGIGQAFPSHLSTISGLGKAKYAVLMAALELGKRANAEIIQVGEKVSTPNAVKSFLASKLQNLTQEIFVCLFLNTQNRVICLEKLFSGSLTETSVYPREVVKRALTHNAAKVILAHNHPSGHTQPSQADKEVTHILQRALTLIEVKVIDHIIIGKNESFSFAEHGYI